MHTVAWTDWSLRRAEEVTHSHKITPRLVSNSSQLAYFMLKLIFFNKDTNFYKGSANVNFRIRTECILLTVCLPRYTKTEI